MARTIQTSVQSEFDKPVTRVGYLVELSTSPALRWCDLGTLAWGGNTYVAYDFTVRGIVGVGVGRAGTLEVQNLDDAAAAALVDADMSSVICTIWQVAPAAIDATGVNSTPGMKLGEFHIGDMEITLDKLRIQLVATSAMSAFSPRRRVDPANGFYYALPEGTQIAWENEVYVVGAERA